MALHSGGFVVDHGWLRIYGGGCPERGLPSLAEANRLTGEDHDVPSSFSVGHDVVSGRFELNGPNTDRPGKTRRAVLLRARYLEWEPLGMGYGELGPPRPATHCEISPSFPLATPNQPTHLARIWHVIMDYRQP
jgi:hypothetical protein